jgi:hypothetical protein
MTSLPEIHLCIQQPAGYVHSLGLLDQARYFRWQFRRLGAKVTMAKNRLRHDAVNFVFGAHLGFDATQRERHACVFVNLEQLGEGGARVSPDYLALLGGSAVVDYDAANVASYTTQAEDVPVVPLLHAPYLKPTDPIPLEERPIDLLFIGSMNERRRAWLDRIEALGHSVTMFDGPLYGPERDQFIMQAKAVVNAHFYETSRFEQARVAHCLSLGTPVISERAPQTQPHPGFEDCVLWLEGDQLEQFFAEDFGTASYFDLARQALQRFEQADPAEAYADLLAFAAGFAGEHHKRRDPSPWSPQQIHFGAGSAYRAGWFNIDGDASAQPDLVHDLGAPLALPLQVSTEHHGVVDLVGGGAARVHATALPGQAHGFDALLDNALRLLGTGGELHFEWTPDGVATPGRSSMRGLHDAVLKACSDQYWQLGWFEHRFEMTQCLFFDQAGRECAREQAARARVVLCKVEASLRERTLGRTQHADLRLPDDAPAADQLISFELAPVLAVMPPAERVGTPVGANVGLATAQGNAPGALPTNEALARLRREPLAALGT